MTHRLLSILSASLAASLWAYGQPAKCGPATSCPPATATSSAACTSAPAEQIDPAAMEILRRLENATEKNPRLSADLDYHVDMLQLADSEHRTGKVYYQAADQKSPAKFRIHFDTLRQGEGVKAKRVVDYAFDGNWLTVRKQRIKQWIRYQLAPPGVRVDLLQLGKGPFPVPFGQKAETVIEHFTVATRARKQSDPPEADYLKLTTRPRHKREMKLEWIEMWVQRASGLPVKIVAQDKSENRTTVLFKNITTPEKFSQDTFDLPRPPPGAGWDSHIEPYRGPVK